MKAALLRIAVVLTVAAAGLLIPVAGPAPTGSTAQAADLQFFDAGNIISDAVFFDGLSMDGPAIQAFLNLKGANCVAFEMPCLKDYVQTTANQPADQYCAGYAGAPNESAANIIAKVGASCRVSPKALLVLLQKEQGLITKRSPTFYAYDHATGFGCPDGSACNPAFSGIVSQLYFGARQFQRYAAGDAGYYRAGRYNTIAYAPAIASYNNINNARCGTSQVFIANTATAGLYSYTPYRPNAAALAAGYGEGDDCSTYGNRNFWNYFTDWFGSTQSPGAAAILARYDSLGGRSSWLGMATSGYVCGLTRGGCYMHFQGGSIYWSPGSGAHSVRGEIRWSWWAQGWEAGPIGYPTTEEVCGLVNGGCVQVFEGGSLYWSYATGARLVRGAIRDRWASLAAENGPLGYPIGSETCGLVRSGCAQGFVGGSMYWTSTTGARVVKGAIRDRFAALGGQNGFLGYPLTDEICGLVGAGCYQLFQGGSVYWSGASGAFSVRGAIRDRWGATGSEHGPLGYPIADESCGARGGCVSMFQRGAVAYAPTIGTRVVSGDILGAWTTLGRGGGTLGHPVTDTTCGLAGPGCYQVFEFGSEYWTAGTGAHFVRGAIGARWGKLGWETGLLGYPTTDEVCGLPGGGCISTFQNGALVYTGARGALVVRGSVLGGWAAAGREGGVLGYPVHDTICGLVRSGCYQVFDGGSLYSSGGTGAHFVRGAIRERWAALGWENGSLGYPTTDEGCGLTAAGCSSTFEGGRIVWSYGTGAHALTGALLTHWLNQGADGGALGYPLEEARTSGTVTTQRFQGGTLSYNSSTNTWTTS